MRQVLFLLALVACSAPGFAQKLNVSWTDTRPVMDGRMEDACWREAEGAKDFALNPSGAAPTRETEVRFAYDAENLYVFWTCYESNMSPRQVGVMGEAETKRDQIDRDESAELMLYPTRSEKEFYLLAASPRGARFDLSSKAWTDFNPEWRCVAGRFDGGWTIEAKVPFGELAQNGQVFGTPRVGDSWGLQIYRKKANTREVSQWATSGPWGELQFRGPRSGAALPSVTKIDAGSLSYGLATCVLTVEGAATPVEGTCVVFHEGRAVEKHEVMLLQSRGIVSFPYRLWETGSYRVKLELSTQGKPFFSGQGATWLAPVSELVKSVDREIQEGKKVVAGDRHPAFARLREELGAFEKQSLATRKQADRAKELTAEEWQALRDQSQSLASDWLQLKRGVHLARIYPATARQSSISFTLGAATDADKVYRDTLYQGSLIEPIRLAIAGNEFGSFQLVVIPFWQDLKDVSVSFTPLQGPKGRTISADQFRWFRVAYVNLEPPPAWTKLTYAHSHEPDPLLPAAPFTIAEGTVAPVWVDLQLPGGTPGGTYAGMVTVSANGQSVSRRIEVRANGFDIPKRSSIEIDCWFTPISGGWNSFYLNAEKTRGIIPYTPDLHARHAEVLGRYRISSFPSDWTFLCSQVPIHAEPNGTFTFDWSRFDKYIQNGLKNHSTAFWCALSCNSGWTAYLNSADVPIIERATGKRLTIGAIMQAKWDAAGEKDDVARFYGKSQYQNPVYRDFLIAYVKHLKELGINDFSYYELFDEACQDPPPHKRWLAMIEHHQFFRKLVPDLHLLNFGLNPTQVIEGKSAVGLIDVWAPHLFQLDERVVRNFEPGESYPVDQARLAKHRFGKIHQAIIERREKSGEKYWTYTCTEQVDANANYTPYCLYHRPYLSLRIHGWMAWQQQWDGFLVFALTQVPKVNLKPPDQRWPISDWSDGADMGCGTLVYPGPDFELIPGMRLANARNGLQDYEYFALLRREAKKLDSRRDTRLLARIEAALQVDKDIVSSVYVWTKDRDKLEAKRTQLAGLIREARAVQNKRANH